MYTGKWKGEGWRGGRLDWRGNTVSQREKGDEDSILDIEFIRDSSPVNLWFDLDKMATETLFVGNGSHTHPEQHIENIEQSK